MKSINWGKWSAIAEILGAIAIFITLAYLATQTRYLGVQTRQNTAAIQASVRQQMLANDLAILFKEVDDPRLATMGRDGQTPTPEEMAQLNSYMIAVVRVRENQWLQYKNGAIDERTWQTYRAAIPLMFGNPIRRAWWQARTTRDAGEFDPEFVILVNELLAEAANSK